MKREITCFAGRGKQGAENFVRDNVIIGKDGQVPDMFANLLANLESFTASNYTCS